MAHNQWMTVNEGLLCDEFAKFRRYIVFKRFLNNVDIGDPDECWLWKGGHGRYGTFYWYEKKIYKAHIASYELFVGKRHGLCVCHSCDNTLCVNPNHLWLGTQKQNVDDMVKKGRGARHDGEHNPHSKLTLEKVEKIRKLYASGKYTLKELGKKYGVGFGAIGDIVNGETWKN